MIRTAFLLLISYAAAAPLTERISLNLTKTDWLHVATYFWWAASLGVWFAIAALVVVALAALSSR